ncbi:MAG TPA: anthranilate phosphoribosyltransferase, partial [Streptosporangiaceae bacterium]
MDTPTWSALIGTLVKGEALTSAETAWAMGEIMDGAATPAQIAGFGVALRMKGETVAEVSGLAETMLDRATPISVPGPLV